MSNALSDLRLRVATALATPTVLPEDATVLVDVVDSLSPPAYLLLWADPWLAPETFCRHAARLDVVCVAARMDPAPGIETLETMVVAALDRLRAAKLPESTVSPPARFDVGGVPYLAARVSLAVRISTALVPEVVALDVPEPDLDLVP